MKKWTVIFAIVFVVAAIAFGISVAAYGVTWGEYGGVVNSMSNFMPNGEQMPVSDSELTGEYSNVEISVISADTTIIFAHTDKVKVHYETGNASTTVSAEIRNGKLEIRENAQFFLSFLGGSWRKSTLEITMPQKELDKFTYNATSGDIEFEGLTAKKIDLNSVSGNMSLGLFAEDIDINTVSGTISITNCTDKECDSLTIYSTSGDYNVSGFHTRKFTIDTTSGDYNLSGMSGECEINATSGSISVDFDEWTDDVDINLISGNVRLNVPEGSGAEIDFTGMSGSVRARLGGSEVTVAKNSGKTTAGGENVHKVTVTATSGDVRIED